MSPGVIMLSNNAGASIALVGGLVAISAKGGIVETAAGAFIQASGGAMSITAGGDINAAAPNIKLNG